MAEQPLTASPGEVTLDWLKGVLADKSTIVTESRHDEIVVGTLGLNISHTVLVFDFQPDRNYSTELVSVVLDDEALERIKTRQDVCNFLYYLGINLLEDAV